MKIIQKVLSDSVFLIKTNVYEDTRGFFFEHYNNHVLSSIGIKASFVQANLSYSSKGVLRGLHFQRGKYAQGKLVRVVAGEVFDVVVDLRREAKSFGKWEGFTLTEKNADALWIPEGFAHGFEALSEKSVMLYQTTSYYCPKEERTLFWNDCTLGIGWHTNYPLVSEKDSMGKSLEELCNEGSCF